MIKINWSEVEAVKVKLLQGGATDSLELLVIVFYHNTPSCDKINIQLGQIEKVLFELGSNDQVKGVCLYDITMKKPYFQCEEPTRINGLETIPNSGHHNIVLEFDKMSDEARDVWLEIALAQSQHYVGRES